MLASRPIKSERSGSIDRDDRHRHYRVGNVEIARRSQLVTGGRPQRKKRSRRVTRDDDASWIEVEARSKRSNRINGGTHVSKGPRPTAAILADQPIADVEGRNATVAKCVRERSHVAQSAIAGVPAAAMNKDHGREGTPPHGDTNLDPLAAGPAVMKHGRGRGYVRPRERWRTMGEVAVGHIPDEQYKHRKSGKATNLHASWYAHAVPSYHPLSKIRWLR